MPWNISKQAEGIDSVEGGLGDTTALPSSQVHVLCNLGRGAIIR